MRTIKKHGRVFALVGGLFGAFIATALLTYLSTARATGIPQNDPLFYSGLLTDTAGNPLSGNKSIAVYLWDAETGGSTKCSTGPASTPLTQGRFRVALDAGCMTAIRNDAELWVEVTVDGASMGRTKIGAAPYAAAIPATVKVDGDASLTIHSSTNTPTADKKMLSLKTGATTPKEVFAVDSEGDINGSRIQLGGSSGPLTENWWEFGLDDGATGTGIDFHGGDVGGFLDFTARIYRLGGNNGDWVFTNRGTGSISIGSDATPGLTIQASGDVGVGTATPAEKLHVAGSAHIDGDVLTTGLVRHPSGTGVAIQCRENLHNVSFQWKTSDGSGLTFWVDNQNVKTFVIRHPTDDRRHLVHATLEGPEAAVFYRGTARLKNGRARIRLPHYFEALTREQGRTITLTNIDGFDRLAVKRVGDAKINDGAFLVVSDNRASTQEFDWEVKATRKDVPPLQVEPYTRDVDVRGDGPYRYATPRSR